MPNYDEITKSAYEEMELHLISSMKRNLGLHIAEEIKTGKEYPQWQAIKLRELRKYQKENSYIIDRSVGDFPEDVAKQLENELKQGAVQEQHRYNIANGATMDVSMGEGFFRLNRNKLTALQKSVNNDLSNANTAALRMMNDTYRSTIYKYELFLANGVYTPTQAYDAAVKDFLERGINCIEYKDGRRVNIADYTDMAIKTANKRAQLMGEGSFRKSIGNPLIIISAHNTSCKLCKPFQNKVLIDDVYSGGTQEDGDYMLLSEAMERGLYHPRCKHGCGTYYPEIEHINQYETPENKLNEYGDKAINSAHIDNMIQRYKRLVAGSVDKNNIEKYQQQLKLWEQEQEKIKEKMATDTTDDKIQWLEPGNTISDAEYKGLKEYADKKGIVLNGFKKSDVDVELAKEFIDETSKMLEEFPVLKGSKKKPFTLELSRFMSDNDFAETTPGVKHIIKLNANAMRNKNKLAKEYSKLASEGWFVRGTDYKSIIYHEFGHLVEDYYHIDTKQIVEVILNSKIYEKYNLLKSSLSIYAIEKIDGTELMAEVFSGYYGGNKNELLLTIMDKCVKLIKKR